MQPKTRTYPYMVLGMHPAGARGSSGRWCAFLVEKEYSHHTTRSRETFHCHSSLVGSYVNGKVQFITLESKHRDCTGTHQLDNSDGVLAQVDDDSNYHPYVKRECKLWPCLNIDIHATDETSFSEGRAWEWGYPLYTSEGHTCISLYKLLHATSKGHAPLLKFQGHLQCGTPSV